MIDETVFNQVIGDLFYDKRQEALARTALVRYLGALDHAQRQERVIRLAVPYISQWVADPAVTGGGATVALGICGRPGAGRGDRGLSGTQPFGR